MGREIKRVALDFDWPMEKIWKGFLNPYYKYELDCSSCKGTGWIPGLRHLSDTFYNHNVDSGNGWRDKITQVEVQALVDEERLYDFTHDWTSENGWVEKDPPYVPTAEEVNKWATTGFGHDAVNQMILVVARAKSIGYIKEREEGYCTDCSGHGVVWVSEEYKNLCEEWEETPPPKGPGFQVWETVSEGSPISPVFSTQSEIIVWLMGEGYSRKAAESFIESEWVPSFMLVEGKMYKNIESAVLIGDDDE